MVTTSRTGFGLSPELTMTTCMMHASACMLSQTQPRMLCAACERILPAIRMPKCEHTAYQNASVSHAKKASTSRAKIRAHHMPNVSASRAKIRAYHMPNVSTLHAKCEHITSCSSRAKMRARRVLLLEYNTCQM